MNTKVNPLNLSDSDFIDTPEPGDEETTTETTETTEETPSTDATSTTEEEEPSEETTKEDPTFSASEEENTEESSTDTETTEEPEGDIEKEPVEKTEAKSKDTDTSADEKSESSKESKVNSNYEEEYKKLIAPFRANGKNMQVKSVDDAVTLMKMGANYNKKMAALKPNLRLMKMLQNNDLLDEGKLTYLIDLDKKNPEAVHKFIKESGIDPLDVDNEKDTDYQPSTYTVNDKEVELDGVLDEIRDTDSFSKTIDIIGTKWDASSKKVLIETPGIIKVINEQVSNGIFDKITEVIDSERMLGRLQGLSDLEAYKQVGEAIQARGGFNSMTTATETTNTTEEISTTSKKSQDDPKLKSRKRAASSTRSAPGGTKKDSDYNPLALSDAEFEKVASNDFI